MDSFSVQQRTVALWGQFVIILHASWLQHVTFHHFPRLALCKDLGWPTVYNTAHSACCSSMKFLFIGGPLACRESSACSEWGLVVLTRLAGLKRWLRGDWKTGHLGLVGVKKATGRRVAASVLWDGPCQSFSFGECWTKWLSEPNSKPTLQFNSPRCGTCVCR